jgi:hypothetical protein
VVDRALVGYGLADDRHVVSHQNFSTRLAETWSR